MSEPRENKFGEIVFTPTGELKEINGYIGNGISFEYVELQEYERLKLQNERLKDEIKTLREALEEIAIIPTQQCSSDGTVHAISQMAERALTASKERFPDES